MVRADDPFKKWQDVIDFARKNPGQLAYGTPGPGTTPHLAMEKIALQEKVKFQHVPFQGDSPAMAAILGGHVMAAATGALAWKSHVKAGALRLLLVFDPEGMDEWPEVPTFKKIGTTRGAHGPMVSAPKGLPKPIVDRLIVVFSNAVMSPQFQKVAARANCLAAKPLTGVETIRNGSRQYDMYGTFIKEIGLQKRGGSRAAGSTR